MDGFAPRILEEHEAARAFPPMPKKRFAELRDDIAANGLVHAITLCEGKILDGRHRYAACREVGCEPHFEEFTGNPWQYAWSANGQRRDLNQDQRYLLFVNYQEKAGAWEAETAAKVQTKANQARSEAAGNRSRTEKGAFEASSRTTSADSGATRDRAAEEQKTARTAKAKAAGTNRGTTERMDTLRKKRPDLAEKVMHGEIKPTEAQRQMRKDSVAEKVEALPEGKYRVIYADPPWQYNDERAGLGSGDGADGAVDRASTAAKNHYPTMSKAELTALDVRALAADDAVLWCWATFPLLPVALDVVKAWGFKYKTAFVWNKGSGSFGHYHKADAELLLVATRGACTPDAENRVSQIIAAPREGHSRKPEQARELIDGLYPHGPRIELFRRGGPVEHWQAWGNEAA